MSKSLMTRTVVSSLRLNPVAMSLDTSMSTTTKSNGNNSSADGRKEHIVLTSSQTRNPIMFNAHIKSITDLSPTIKGYELKIDDSPTPKVHPYFEAGQWVDFFIPGVDKVGGFSMWREPERLEKEGVLDLAIKFSTWPVAHWMHTKAEVGSAVAMRVGGDFHYPNETTKKFKGSHDVLLVAGGVGINPLASIFFHASAQQLGDVKVTLLYSASSYDELIFKDKIDDVCKAEPRNFTCDYFITREHRSDVTTGRISIDDLSRSLKRFENSEKRPVFCFICGPTPMIQSVDKNLQNLGISKDHIFYELWW